MPTFPRVVTCPRLSPALARSLPLLAPLLLVGMLLSAGCAPKEEHRAATPPPRSIFTGPEYLHGTIGSVTLVSGAEPELVSSYALVAGLNGTGSADVPPHLRTRFINEMRKQGVQDPSRWLAGDDTAMVKVRGLVPPGAVKGQHFDLLVEALPQTQTTSLYGGRLWSTDLAVGGANPQGMARHPVATGRGPIYVNPLGEREENPTAPRQHTMAVVLSGGTVTVNRKLELVLNNPSWDMARIVADRINERFGHEAATEFFNTAVPRNQQLIQINVPARFAGKSEEFVELIQHLYYQRGSNFEVEKAGELGHVLVADPTQARSVTVAWHGLGKRALPVLREYYEHPQIPIRMAALEAGARLADEGTSAYLEPLAQSPDPMVRHQVASIFEYLPSSLVGARVLARLVDDEDRAVRLRAYDVLASIDDPRVERYVFGNETDFKFVLDLVPSDKPLIYVVHDRMPRVAIFGPRMTLRTPLMARLWNNTLILKAEDATSEMQVFYQAPGELNGKIYNIKPLVAELAGFIAHRSTIDYPAPGLDLNYSAVVDALNALCKGGYLDAEIEIEESTLAQLVEREEQNQYGAIRAETAASPAGAEGGEFLPLDRESEPDAASDRQEGQPAATGSEAPPVEQPRESAAPLPADQSGSEDGRGWRHLPATQQRRKSN